MKRTAILLFCLVLSIALLTGCSDKTASNGSLSTNPELASAMSTASIASMEAKTETKATEAENWDGISPLEYGRFYRIEGIESIRKALANNPEMLKNLEQQLTKAAQIQSRRQVELPRIINYDEVYETALRLLADNPEALRQVEKLLSTVSFPYKPVQTDLRTQSPEKQKLEIKRIFAKEITDESSSNKIKALGATKLSGLWAVASANCQMTGWTTYPQPVRKQLRNIGDIQWESSLPDEEKVYTYAEFEEEPSTTVFYYHDTSYALTGQVLFDRNHNLNNNKRFCVAAALAFPDGSGDGDADLENWFAVMKGDCDLSGGVDCAAADLLKMLRFLGGQETPAAGDQQYAADVDDNGTLNTFDLLALLSIISSLCG